MIFWALAAFAAASLIIPLLLRAGAARMGSGLGRLTAQRFEEAEELINNNRLPAAWQEELKQIHEDGQPACLQDRFEELRTFFRNAPVFDTGASRQVFLQEISHAEACQRANLSRSPRCSDA